MSTVLITGAATGIGNLTARALARAGHRVHASMRAPETRKAARAKELHRLAEAERLDLNVVELDVTSQESADRAVAALAGTDPRTPLAGPPHADLRGLPPLLIQAGGREIPLDDDAAQALDQVAAFINGHVQLEERP
ncbi:MULTISPECIES: SDR family NAD(P)-dependent oxidoreductase [Streptomycetaceae]|uniref:Short-chain dehydrogenase/reductase SDR n=1 Tax=Streptantibioticus cattleyicolor (strain ATCC 35852 / DSM 46488 / JCM 4925 / NBRC 14057 / NRRL 8057) TaxID=1003195 RepID=F8K337_STREN|nr:SDR family NAD(P)-dependent oxidoreductase [Streptantibioticus cattleyicolor]AEW92535.1 short-chain dehydrogenase/reductase SDR [Streptantibioticus cattleyicolor NRRL 8057 = DSM 46488]MYS57328.1 SDR family NAD(P)-dependent oxidoreductase [Streptomyces sp. SID5468]CCB72894.1 protein of unknown function [Streptantibioticus cattleyicolor NRRL 8057 = DSM 46488]